MSEQAKHTPGTWQVEGETVYCLDDLLGINRFTAHVQGHLCTPEELRANAQVMGASSDLLAACRPVLAEAKERADYLHDTWNPHAHVELTLAISELRAIHAAVAKATGAK